MMKRFLIRPLTFVVDIEDGRENVLRAPSRVLVRESPLRAGLLDDLRRRRGLLEGVVARRGVLE
jgi:hypothetical protein